MDNNDTNTTHRFIFNDNFYENLNQENSKLPPQRDLLAPIGEQVKEIPKQEEKPIVEQLDEIKIDMPEVVETTTDIEEVKNEEPEPISIEIPDEVENTDIIDTNVDINSLPEEEIPEINIIPIEEKEETPIEVNEEPVIEVEEPTPDTLEVNTGIDRNLEQEIFNTNKVENEQEFFYRPIVEDKPRNVYRAARRPRVNISVDTDTNQEEPTEVVPIRHIEKVSQAVPQKIDTTWVPPYQPEPIIINETINYYEEEEKVEATKSNLIDELKKKEASTGKISILARYGDDFCSHDYITNPAIGRANEIKELDLILLTPDKSAILVGKPGIGKTSIVEGLAYKLQRNQVPEALKGYTIVSVKTASLLGSLPNGETRLQTLVDELKDLDKIILFIDEIHMLMNASDGSNLDFANLFKESLGRGSIKMIGATTSEEYERYVLRDKAFVRRFQRVDVNEPTKEQTVEIIMGTLPKIEANTGAKMMYTHYVQVEIMKYIVDITSEYKRVYGIGSRYPDICLTLVTQAFSEAVFDNRKEVNIKDIRNAILKSKNIYPDVIKKEIVNFDKQFKDLLEEAK